MQIGRGIIMKKFGMVHGYLIGFFIGMIVELSKQFITNYLIRILVMVAIFSGGLWIVLRFEKK